MADQNGTPGNAPNQFAQVGMGGSQGGGQFEQDAGQSGSLQDQQGGTTTTRSVPVGEEAARRAAQQEQGQSHERLAPIQATTKE
ncbi:hypothetical protein GCM10011515_21760 [Tsuneonella deserti]|uniref:Uncharacterized protein n=1 Tax=Tsuneonella deserti TaxID=2035528 RepID=A0ABQ1S9N9_9SPHN|nr:hypothetical protein [Tsuneonella deserti]GGE01731.1 hypothetical protein GCM10011515_21760 [Tsuneonella deserti]